MVTRNWIRLEGTFKSSAVYYNVRTDSLALEDDSKSYLLEMEPQDEASARTNFSEQLRLLRKDVES